jgi:hypothetical protein
MEKTHYITPWSKRKIHLQTLFPQGESTIFTGFHPRQSIAKDCLQKLKTRIANNQRQALQGFTQVSIAKNCLQKLYK